MTLKFHKAHSSESPVLKDETSSKTSVYIRKNVVQNEITDEETGETRIEYEYDEAILSKDEYARYQDNLETLELIAELTAALLGEE